MAELLAILTNKVVAPITAAVAVILAIYSGISYFNVHALKGHIEELTLENAELTAKVKTQQQIVKESLEKIELVKAQCEILLDYERRKPKKPEATNEDPDNDFINRLFDGVRLRAPNAPAIVDTDTSSPPDASGQPRVNPYPRPYPIKVRPEGSLPRR